MKKLAFMIVPLKDGQYLFHAILDKIYVEFAGCTYYEVKGMWSGNHRDDQTIPCIKIEIAMDLKKTEEFLKIASYALKNIKCQELMVQLPSGEIKFLKDKGAAGLDEDGIGWIRWYCDNSAQEETLFCQILGAVETALDTDEAGKLELIVAKSNGTSSAATAGLTLTGHGTNNLIDVSIGSNGSSALSTTTIAGNMTVNGDTHEFSASTALASASKPAIQIKNNH